MFNVINNLRKWFSKDEYKDFKKEDIIITNLTKENLFDGKFVNGIELEDIKKAIDFLNNSVIPNPDKFIQIIKKEETKDKPDNPDNVSKGLDLDEIHQLNIMNSIIQSLNDINETLKGIKDLMSKQSFSENLPQSKQSFSERRKLGRFKVEKYKPNMSITEFKKLFDSKP